MGDKSINIEIKVKYSCHRCGLKDAEVLVSARSSEDVIEWLNQTVNPNVKYDHTMRSPRCTATSFQNLMIPITGTDMVGGPAVQ